MKKVLCNILAILYAILAVFITICLLSFNDYKISEFGSYSLVIIDNKELEPEFKKGSLVVTNRDDKIEVGDSIFFCKTYRGEVIISVAKVESVEQYNKVEAAYTLEGDERISGDEILGKADKVTKIETLGTILSILESKWGFLIAIVFPSLLAFVYEITEVVSELRKKTKKDKE